MSRKSCCSIAALISLLAAALLNGCGSDNREGTTVAFARVSEAECAQCHGQAVSAVTGNSIYAGWQQSSHFLLAKLAGDPNAAPDQVVAADCQRCHGGGSDHRGIGPIQFPQPDVAGICLQCHNEATMLTLSPAHFTSAPVDLTHPLGTDATATYVDSQTRCVFCHDPHNSAPAKQPGQWQDWAGSEHGDTKGAPWVAEDFGAPAQAQCARCHTASGYKLYLQNPNAAGGWAWKTGAAAGDPNKEVLRCDGCHVNYAFVRRNGATNGADAAKLPYTPPTGALVNNLLTNAGDSNLCVNCHTGRASGVAITTTTFANRSSAAPNSHYKAAAGILYGIIGFEGYSSNSTHAKYVGADFRHDQIGLNPAFNSPTDLGTSRGPCVGCHYTSLDGARFSHSLDTFEGTTGLTGTATGQVSVVCANCHVAGTSLQLTAAELNIAKTQYKGGLDAIATLLQARYGIVFDPEKYPYFWADLAETKSNINWSRLALAGGDTRSADARGRRLAGSAFNLNLLTREPGAYAHNHKYAMTLIFDAIDYLENGAVTGVLTGTPQVPLATLQAIFGVTADGVTPVTARPI